MPISFMIDGPPEVVLNAINLHEDLIQMPLPLSVLTHVRSAFRADLPGEDWTKAIDPESHALMANIDATLVE